jgi:hypothetical protein
MDGGCCLEADQTGYPVSKVLLQEFMLFTEWAFALPCIIFSRCGLIKKDSLGL